MLPEDIQQLISTTPRKERKTQNVTFDVAVDPFYTQEITLKRTSPDSLLTEYTFETPPAPMKI
jgi:hypothetical protein